MESDNPEAEEDARTMSQAMAAVADAPPPIPWDGSLPEAMRSVYLGVGLCVVGLRDKSIFFVTRAMVVKASKFRGIEWVHLTVAADADCSGVATRIYGGNPTGLSLGRGVDVRISEIVWAADSPFGG